MILLEIPETVEGDLVDITDKVQRAVERSNVQEGAVVVSVVGSTAALTTIEHEPGLEEDMREACERLFPRSLRYHHEEAWHDGNGHSHVRAGFIGPSLTLVVSGGRLVLGQWQQVVLLEFDNKRRSRKVAVQVLPAGNP